MNEEKNGFALIDFNILTFSSRTVLKRTPLDYICYTPVQVCTYTNVSNVPRQQQTADL